MILTMVQLRNGEDLFDWSRYSEIFQVNHSSPNEHQSSSQPTRSDTSGQKIDTPDADTENSSLPEPTAENPATAARTVQIYSTVLKEETAESGKEDENSEKIPPQQTGSDSSSSDEKTSDAFVLFERNGQGQLEILGISWQGAAVFAIESLFASILIMWLLMSGFNKKSFRQTFKNFDKIFIFILCSLLGTLLLGGTDIWVTRKWIAGKTDRQPQTAQPDTDAQPENQNSDAQTPDDSTAVTDPAVDYRAATRLNSDTALDFGEYTSDRSDESALWVDGAAADLSSGQITKTGSTDALDNASRYGLNAAVLASNGARLTMGEMKIDSDAAGAAGIFSSGSDTRVILSGSSIQTQQDNAPGIQAADEGSIEADDVTLSTYGHASPAVDAGENAKEIQLTGGSYTTYGSGSPAIHSQADIEAKDVSFFSSTSEGVIVESGSRVSLEHCTLEDTNTVLDGDSAVYKNIFLYNPLDTQTLDSPAVFRAVDSTLSTSNGVTFYITNTDAQINLSNNTISYLDPLGSFLRAEAGPWGKTGANGAIVHLNLDNQWVYGDLHADSSSELYMQLKSGSYIEGAINPENSARKLQLVLDAESSLKLTGDCYVSKLTNEDKSWSNIDYNGYTLYVDGKGWNESNAS